MTYPIIISFITRSVVLSLHVCSGSTCSFHIEECKSSLQSMYRAYHPYTALGVDYVNVLYICDTYTTVEITHKHVSLS